MELAAGMQGQHGVAAHVSTGAFVERVGAHHALIHLLAGSQADCVGTQLRVELERNHRHAVGEGHASPEVPLSCAPLQDGRGGCRHVAGEGLDLRALAAGNAVVEMSVARGQAAFGQFGYAARLDEAGELRQV